MRNAASMKPIGERLRSEGYTVINHDYPSRDDRIEEIVSSSIEPLMDRKEVTDAEHVHFVTHSMGGILVRRLMQTRRPPNLGRVVMLGPPNHGSDVVDEIGHWSLFSWINGPAGQQLGTGANGLPETLGPVDYPVGVIAGDRSINWINSAMITGPDDGKVSVESSKLDGMTDHIVVHRTHPMMMRSGEVIDLVVQFLQNGSFGAN